MKITLPLPENRANARWHWTTERKKRDDYYLRATMACQWRPQKPLQALKVHATLYTYNRMDEDNLAARMKWPMDWMELRGFVEDDKHIALTCEQAVDRKNQRVEITLEAA